MIDNYESVIFGKKYEVPNIKIFNQLKEIINNVEWINKSIFPQQHIFKL